MSSLVGAGVDLLVLETFHHIQEIRVALQVAKRVLGDEGVVVAQMSFQDDGNLQDGTSPTQVAQLLEAWGADLLGINCGDGPAGVYDVAVEMRKAVDTPIIACPNAGQPTYLDTRTIYMCTPEYFGVYARRLLKAGIQAVGGCCGVRDDHIESIASAARMLGGGNDVQPPAAIKQHATPTTPRVERKQEIPVKSMSSFAAKVYRVWEARLGCGTRRCAPGGPHEFVTSVEVNPQAGLSVRNRIKAVKMLKDAGVDVVNIADGPRATVRMSNTAFALAVTREVETEVILHVCCRDRNLLGLQSDILGYHVMGMHNLVVITGDPPKMGDYPKASAVFDLDSIDLLELVQGFNHGIDPAGKMVKDQTHFFLACGAEPAAVDYEREMSRLEKKIKNGARLIMTQPVYDPDGMLPWFAVSVRMPWLLSCYPSVNSKCSGSKIPG